MIRPPSRDLEECAPALRELLRSSEQERRASGYYHTLREICQQPETWPLTAAAALSRAPRLRAALADVRSIVLTGSGSSLYAGECLAPALRADLRIPVETVGGGDLLTNGEARISPLRPCLAVSLARSGDSPESCAAVDLLLATAPDCRHLAITCNARGRLAANYRDRPAFETLLLEDRINDRSLVMTSSFTNMVVAGRTLGVLDRAPAWRANVDRLAAAAAGILAQADALAGAARRDFRTAVYLASWVRFGAAREAALKMLEMTAGRVHTFPETFLGLRHGPMSVVHQDAAVACFLSSSEPARAYELDLIRELDRKGLAALKIVAGERVPADALRPGDIAIEYPEGLADADVTVLDAVVGQLLAFFRCRHEGLRPDAPSESEVITRVVEPFRIHAIPESEAL
jgi:tagatose-6-phosphate ketose/aldose isomerase